MAGAKSVSVLLLCMVLSAAMFNVEALTCGTVATDLSQCLGYLKNWRVSFCRLLQRRRGSQQRC
ncbi:hypothetical protein OIU77_020480 [Salix suchowensis]|uniref:Uncharacterized protein n=1 Tax=Salix suchowensis TaxID=1278906 RepID=A0ABQ9C6K1_9ROSI|nr:hypothetical protein OIU77_020480 [Salix suchowensis]